MVFNADKMVSTDVEHSFLKELDNIETFPKVPLCTELCLKIALLPEIRTTSKN